jgi:hypothetical protein
VSGAQFYSPFCRGEKVWIDGDPSITAWVTAHMWYTRDHHEVQCSWVHNGQNYSAWIDTDRLSAAK